MQTRRHERKRKRERERRGRKEREGYTWYTETGEYISVVTTGALVAADSTFTAACDCYTYGLSTTTKKENRATETVY